MPLPLAQPYLPMEALAVKKIPEGPEWQYEPKWDGFRCIAFRDHGTVLLQSKSGQPLARYFPDLVASIGNLKPGIFVLDGEIVVPDGDRFSFDHLLMRIHPAASRVQKLAHEHPAKIIVFDLLVDENGRPIVGEELSSRREKLESFGQRFFSGSPGIELSPATHSILEAKKWLSHAGGNMDGVIAKRSDLSYQSGERTGMQKIKKLRTAECVVGGFRYASKAKVIGSMLLGLYNGDGLLDHVGFTSGFSTEERKNLTPRLEKLIGPPGFTGKAPGGPSRWSTERSSEYNSLKPKLVIEVQYDHFTGGRFRHGTKFLRFRPEKPPLSCTFDQIQT